MTAAQDMIRGRSNIVTMTNNSGGGLVAGDVCVQDTTADEKVTTTTSAASTLKVFVAAETVASNAAGKFYESGYCPLVNVNASVTRGRFLFTHTVAKQAAENATYGAGAFGKLLKSGTTPSAIIYSATAQISSGIARSGSTTDNHLAVWDGSNADSLKDGGTGSGGASTADPFVIGKGTAADLSAAVQIPGLSGDPDRKAAGGSDDEFDALSGWTTLGALDTSNVTDYQSIYHIKKNTSGTQVDGIYKACPTIPFTFTAKLCDWDISANYQTPGIFIGESPLDGKMESWGPQQASAAMSNVNIQRNAWTNRTTRGASTSNTTNPVFYGFPIYLRIVVNSSTDVDFAVSQTGWLFRKLITAYNPGFTVGSVGICVSGFAAVPVEALFDWVRFT